MEYRGGQVGRLFVARLDQEDDLLAEMKSLIADEKIEAAVIYVIGALGQARMVVGPREAVIPPEPVWKSFDDGREILGIATSYMENGEPALHLHAAVGRGDTSLTGCIREIARTYLTVEMIIIEILGTGAIRQIDPSTGLKLLAFR